MKLDLSRFKKAKDASGHAIFSHPDGHQIMVNKKALHKKHVNELAKIPMNFDEGGSVPIVLDDDKATEIPTQNFKGLSDSDNSVQVIGSDNNDTLSKIMNDSRISDSVKDKMMQDRGVASQMDLGGNKTYQVLPRNQFAPPELSFDQNQPQDAQPSMNDQPSPQPNSMNQAPADPMGTDAYLNSYQKDVGSYMQGLKQQAQAEGNLGNAQSQVLQPAISQQQQSAAEYEQNVKNSLNELHNSILDYQNQKMDPNRVMAKKTTAQRIALGIGMLAGGMGQGLNGGRNPAEDFINNQIANDIDSQKQEMNKKANIVSAYQNQFGNVDQAARMSTALHQGIVATQLANEAAKSADPMARARLLQSMSSFHMQAMQNVRQVALQKTMMDRLNNQSTQSQGSENPGLKVVLMQKLGQISPEEAKTAMQEVGKAQEGAATLQQYLESFDTVAKMTGHGFFSPNKAQSAINVMAGRIEKLGEGRFNEDMAKQIAAGLFPQKTDISQDTLQFKRQQGAKFLSGLVSTPTLDAYGIGKPQAPQIKEMPAKR